MVDIDKLNWFLPKDEQKRNREEIIGSLSDYDIEMLILPYRKKECWLNCAILLSELDDVRLIPFLSRILEWYKDLNWPGSEVIHKRIK